MILDLDLGSVDFGSNWFPSNLLSPVEVFLTIWTLKLLGYILGVEIVLFKCFFRKRVKDSIVIVCFTSWWFSPPS